VPALETVGVKQMINGPESFTPDGNFILGVAPECANMFVGAGFNAFGIASGGGAGMGAGAVGSRWRGAARPVAGRYQPLFATCIAIAGWVRDRTLEAYGKHYTIGFPHEEYSSGGRGSSRRSTNGWRQQRAVFGSKSSAGSGRTGSRRGASKPRHLFDERQNWFAAVGASTGTCVRRSASSINRRSPNSS
jgi:hypothetical protein